MMMRNIKLETGFSLIELMVTMILGALILTGLVQTYSASNENFGDMKQATERNENGRYALEQVRKDLRHAGFYGDYFDLPLAGSSMPDPCDEDAADIQDALAFPVQGYNNVSTSPLSCLDTSDIVSGSDILVVRRADTTPLSGSDTPVQNEVYLQSNFQSFEIQKGGDPTLFELGSLNADNTVNDVGTTADGSAPTIFKKYNLATASPVSNDLRVAADIRKFHVHIYFVSPCNVPAGSATSCTGSNDDDGNPIPTLKRLELTSVSGSTTFSKVSLVEGVENMQIDYGIDNSLEENVGYGTPDQYVASPTTAQFSNIVSSKVYFLVRNLSTSEDYSDSKKYRLGSSGLTTATGDAYKRHVYSTTARISNVSGRREVAL